MGRLDVRQARGLALGAAALSALLLLASGGDRWLGPSEAELGAGERPVSRTLAVLASRPSGPSAAEVAREMEADVRRLSLEIGPRPSGSAAFEQAVAWAAARLEESGAGKIEVEVERFPLPSASPPTSANVLGTLRGGALAHETVLLAAHLDSVPGSPGAADDAAGVALVLDAARTLAALRPGPARTVRFALFGAEEEGMVGSSFYARKRRGELSGHAAVLVLDMGSGPVLGVATGWNRRFGLAALSPVKALPGLGGLHALDGSYGGSDALDFYRAGVPVLAPLPSEPRYAQVRHSGADLPSAALTGPLLQSGGVVPAIAWVLANAPGPSIGWRLDGAGHRRLLASLRHDLDRVRERDEALDAAFGPLPPPTLRPAGQEGTVSPASGAPPAPRDGRS